MKWYRSLLVFLLATFLANTLNAAFWFQIGARGGIQSDYNNGASISIQTITPQGAASGSPAFWVGETLQNGAFIQMGYLVVNESGSYPTACNVQGCAQYEDINTNQAEWFYEYFPQNYYGADFYGAIGTPGSAGANGMFNTYGFYSNGTVWNFLFNGKQVGSIDLGTGSSGIHTPSAFGEIANASNNDTILNPVVMSNLSIYTNGRFVPVTEGLSYVGFGSGSQQDIHVPYGVNELDNRVNYFEVGSGIPELVNDSVLWSIGYLLKVISAYANVSESVNVIPYSKIPLNAPGIFYISNNTRAVFERWAGSGYGSYSGPLNNTYIVSDSNVTESADWQLQYSANITSQIGYAAGTGWYAPNSAIRYSIESNTILGNGTSRYVFDGWNNGAESPNSSITISGPISIEAIWTHQYFVNATSEYGNVSGSGWYPANTTTMLKVSPSTISTGYGSRIAFYSWSNGNPNSTATAYVDKPVSLYAYFKPQYLDTILSTDEYGNPLPVNELVVNGKQENSSQFLFSDQEYNVTQAYYKGMWLQTNTSISINSSSTSRIILPVYNLGIITTDIFGIPLNASVSLRFLNGTVVNTFTGSHGELLLQDVPYGMASGSLSYFVFNTNVNLHESSPLHLIFLSVFDIMLIAAICIAAAIFYLHSSRRLRHNV